MTSLLPSFSSIILIAYGHYLDPYLPHDLEHCSPSSLSVFVIDTFITISTFNISIHLTVFITFIHMSLIPLCRHLPCLRSTPLPPSFVTIPSAVSSFSRGCFFLVVSGPFACSALMASDSLWTVYFSCPASWV